MLIQDSGYLCQLGDLVACGKYVCHNSMKTWFAQCPISNLVNMVALVASKHPLVWFPSSVVKHSKGTFRIDRGEMMFCFSSSGVSYGVLFAMFDDFMSTHASGENPFCLDEMKPCTFATWCCGSQGAQHEKSIPILVGYSDIPFLSTLNTCFNHDPMIQWSQIHINPHVTTCNQQFSRNRVPL